MTLEEIETFLAVVEKGNIRDAWSEILHSTEYKGHLSHCRNENDKYKNFNAYYLLYNNYSINIYKDS